MPVIPFDALPDAARVWVFGGDGAIRGAAAEQLLGAVDHFLAGWRAHGEPLTSARALREERFLVIGVDQTRTGASGCSIDGLFRVLRELEPALGASLLGGDRVYYRNAAGAVAATSREAFAACAAAGELGPMTRVFDTTVATVGELRERFERAAADSWHARLAPALGR